MCVHLAVFLHAPGDKGDTGGGRISPADGAEGAASLEQGACRSRARRQTRQINKQHLQEIVCPAYRGEREKHTLWV